jgi:hypothetical protein
MCGSQSNLTVLRSIVWGVNFVFFVAGVLLAAVSVRAGCGGAGAGEGWRASAPAGARTGGAARSGGERAGRRE